MSPTAYATIILVSVIGFIMWPHLFSKSYATDSKTAKKTVLAYPIFALFLIPLLLAGFAAVGVVSSSQIDTADDILPYLITAVLNLPGWLYGLVGAGALAAAMSSADAITHSAALEFHDGVVKNVRPGATEVTTVRTMRLLVVLIGAMAYLVTIFGGQGLVALLLGAYGSIVQFAPGVYGALYSRRVTPPAILAGLVVGGGGQLLLPVLRYRRPIRDKRRHHGSSGERRRRRGANLPYKATGREVSERVPGSQRR